MKLYRFTTHPKLHDLWFATFGEARAAAKGYTGRWRSLLRISQIEVPRDRKALVDYLNTPVTGALPHYLWPQKTWALDDAGRPFPVDNET